MAAWAWARCAICRRPAVTLTKPGRQPPRPVLVAAQSAQRRSPSSSRIFSEAGLDDLAIEWWGKAGDQALRRSAFQEAIAHLAKAIAMADKAAGVWIGRS